MPNQGVRVAANRYLVVVSVVHISTPRRLHFDPLYASRKAGVLLDLRHKDREYKDFRRHHVSDSVSDKAWKSVRQGAATSCPP